jgi:glycosyltransferase involved in cell wall biosynthesis
MKTLPRISVITPFLDLEAYLEEAIQSVLAQDMEEWELLLVDDGSSDKSTAIAKQYASNYPDKIFYLEHEGHVNLGHSASRNYALEKARGEWIAFLDGDDIFLPSRLSNQLKYVGQYPNVTVFCEAALYWYSYADQNAEDKLIYVGVPEGVYGPMELTFTLYPIGEGQAPCMTGLLIKKETLVEKGGLEPIFKKLFGDQAMLSKLYLDQYFYVSNDCNNWYRQRAGSIVYSHVDYSKYTEARLFFMRWFHKYLKRTKRGNLRLTWIIRKHLLAADYPLIYKIFIGLPYRIKKKLLK